ncbi:LPXTG cell wall anchor domain-containing protein [Mammaliicoccus sciuri]
MGMGSNDSSTSSGSGVAKAAAINDSNKLDKEKDLPSTGEQTLTNTTLIGGLFAGIGSLFLFGRRRNEDK